MSSHPATKGRTRKVQAATTSDPRGRLRRISLGLLYLAALSILIVWEYRERLEVLSSECELRDQVKSSLYNRPYERFLDWASSGAAGHVVTLAIPLDLEEVQKNLCLGREYMADVLRALGAQNPSVIVIDKFYSAGACTSTPASTQHLIQSVGALKAPVVVAESTDGLEHEVASSCLVRKPQLDFHAAHVRHGLSRLNSEPERLPLRWLVLSSAPEEGAHASSPEPTPSTAEIPKAEFADSLSLAAVRAHNPAFADQAKIRQLAFHDDHAYANLAIEIPKITTTQLLCATGDQRVLKKWSVSCPSLPALPKLAGKVVVVGAETLTDQKLVLDQHIWGFELQARYIESLLSGDYLGFLAIGWGLGVFALFIFLIEGLPTILVARRPHWRARPLIRYAYPHRRYLWVVFWTVAVIGVSAFIALTLRYLPPLLVYGDILLVAVTRLLFFLAESAEDPFLHAHSHRKEHSMPHSHDPKPVHTSIPAESPEKLHTSPSLEPFIPDEPAEPAPAPKSGNKPGSEGASEG